MRVNFIHLRAGVAGEFLADFLRDISIRQRRVERMPQRMKGEARLRASFAVPLTQHAPLDASALHDALERHRQAALAAATFARERREHRRLADAARLLL